MPRFRDINACGPFAHSSYNVDGRKITHEAPLTGRVQYLIDFVVETIQGYAARHQLDPQELTILDVGSNEGFISNQLWSRGFRNVTGLEPKQHNIDRGHRMRALTSTADDVVHHLGGLNDIPEELGDQQFDVLVLLGVLHHVDDPVGALRAARSMCKGLVILETLTLPDGLHTASFNEAIEPKDVAYTGRSREGAILGLKFESTYFPGSTDRPGLVMVPTRRALDWIMRATGFEAVSLLPGWEESSTNRGDLEHRANFSSTIGWAETSPSTSISFEDEIVEYEFKFCCVPIRSEVLTDIAEYLRATGDEGRRHLISGRAVIDGLTPLESEIARAIAIDPVPKLQIEEAKCQLFDGNYERAEALLMALVDDEPCSDWRTVYRSFFLLSMVDSKERRGDWRELLRFSNPEFPFEALALRFAAQRRDG